MSKSYKVAKKIINMGEKKGQTLFSVRPYSYGTLTTGGRCSDSCKDHFFFTA